MELSFKASTRSSFDLTPYLLRVKDLSPVMAKTEKIFLRTARKFYRRSGITTRTGHLFRQIKSFHGKSSAGAVIKPHGGQNLVYPKAVVLQEGAQKGEFTKNKRYTVKRHSRRMSGKAIRIKRHTRRQESPWGNVKARPFMSIMQVSGPDVARIKRLIQERINDRS